MGTGCVQASHHRKTRARSVSGAAAALDLPHATATLGGMQSRGRWAGPVDSLRDDALWAHARAEATRVPAAGARMSPPRPGERSRTRRETPGLLRAAQRPLLAAWQGARWEEKPLGPGRDGGQGRNLGGSGPRGSQTRAGTQAAGRSPNRFPDATVGSSWPQAISQLPLPPQVLWVPAHPTWTGLGQGSLSPLISMHRAEAGARAAGRSRKTGP